MQNAYYIVQMQVYFIDIKFCIALFTQLYYSVRVTGSQIECVRLWQTARQTEKISLHDPKQLSNESTKFILSGCLVHRKPLTQVGSSIVE